MVDIFGMIANSLIYVFDLLNKNSGVLNLLFSALVAISTVIYAYLTSNLVSETKKMRKFQLEPEILITLQPKEGHMQYIYLIIENIGGGPGFNLNFRVEPDFEFYEDKYLSEIGIIKNGLNNISPKQKIEFLLTEIPYLIEEDKFEEFTIFVDFKDVTESRFHRNYPFDLSQFRNISFMPDHHLIPNIKNIKEELAEIKEKMP